MDTQLGKLIKILRLWLRKNELDDDTTFYTIEEWRKRGELYHNNAEFVIATEGGLHFVLNYGDSTELYDLLESFGYYIELGHSWNIGFYKDEVDKPNKTNLSYTEKLRDKRWQDKRKYVLERAEYQCEDCSSKINLEIHHCYYLFGYEPWEYPYDALRCLCKDCHKKRQKIEHILRGHLASLKIEELEAIIKLISTGIYWYPRDQIFSLLKSFDYEQNKTKDIFSRLLTRRTEN